MRAYVQVVNGSGSNTNLSIFRPCRKKKGLLTTAPGASNNKKDSPVRAPSITTGKGPGNAKAETTAAKRISTVQSRSAGNASNLDWALRVYLDGPGEVSNAYY